VECPRKEFRADEGSLMPYFLGGMNFRRFGSARESRGRPSAAAAASVKF
jgi:hypothetical protein